MPFFKDRSGQLWEYDNPDDATRQGMVEASAADIEAHNHALDVKEADQGLLSAAGKGLQSGLGLIQEFASSTGIQPPMAGSEAFGMGGGMPPQAFGQAPVQAPAPPPGAETFPGGFDEQARLEREAHPIAFGAGQGAASAPFAAIAGAAGGAVGGPALLGAGLIGVGAEAATEGAFQEYSDAYFEQRPFELKNVVANTVMFGGLDFAFRGAFKGIGAAFGAAKPQGALGSRNLVSEAQGAARELVDPVGGGSVGAARAADLEEPFVDAIKQMSDRDAAVLARDADDHLHLISQDASEAFTRLNNGLSDDLGSQLKYEDIGTYAQEWEPATIAKQDHWWGAVSDQATSGIEALKQSDYALGNWGKRAHDTLDTFWRRVTDEVDPGQRMVVIDEFKKRLDRLTKSIDASDLDGVAKDEVKAAIAPTRETLRKGLESNRMFGGAADLQKALNKPWHGLLEHWGKVQNTLTEMTGHVKFDQSGAGRITRESTVDRMFSLLGKDPRSNQEFGRHLAGTLENIQGLIDARQAYGIARKDGLDALESDIRNLMEDWNLAQTVGVARNRTAALKRDPRKWATLALNLGERLPMVGQPIQLARTLGDAFTDLHISRKTPLGRVWDTAYQRYAGNTAFQDPAVIGSYSPWVADALKSRGGKFMPPAPPAGAVGSPAMPGMPPANANAQRSVAQPSISPAAQAALERSRARAQQGGSVSLGTGWKTGNANVDAGLEKRLTSVLEQAQKAGEPLTKQQLAMRLGQKNIPEWEVDELERQGLLRRVEGAERPKDANVDVLYAPTQQAAGDASRPMSMKDYIRVSRKVSFQGDELKAVEEYKGGGYRGMNNVLRGDKAGKNADYWAGRNEVLRSALDKQVAAGNTVPGTVFRTMNAAQLPKGMKPGTVFAPPEFLSTSQNPMYARSLESFDDKALMQIEQTTGVPIAKAGATSNPERELLLRPGTKLEFLGEGEANTSDYLTGLAKDFGGKLKVLRFREVPSDSGATGFTGEAKLLRGSVSKHGADARDVADTVLLGKSLADIANADPDSMRPGNLEWLRKDPIFRATGTVKDNFASSESGLPRVVVDAKTGSVSMPNGRHRFTVGRELGLDAIEGVVEMQGPRGGVLWRYRGPIALGKNAPAPSSAPVKLSEQETTALNSAKSSIGSLDRPSGTLKEAQASALQKLSVNNPGQLWRGMRLSEEQLQGIINNGYELTKHTPSSVDRAAAETFAGGVDSKVPVLMQIDGAPRAAMAHGYPGDAFPAERTAILFPGQRYKVVSVEDVTIPPEMDWMQPQTGKLLRLQGEAVAPASRGGERGFVDVAKGLAASPLGVGTAVAGGLGARYAMGQEPEPPPQQAPEHAYRDALREIEQAGQQQVRALATEALRKKPPRGKDRDPLALFSGKRSIQDAVEETRERLDEIAADPSTLLEQLGGSAGDLGKTHPTVYSAYVQKATQVAMYLQSVIPKRTATTLLDSRGGALSFDRAWDYAARFVGAALPRVALREVVRGTAPPEMIEALQENWGEELWDPFRIEMMGQVQRMHAAGRHIPSEKLRRLDSLLGLGGQLDPSATLDVAAHFIAAQDAELAKRQQAGQQTGAMPGSGQAGAQFRTKLAAVAAERQTV